MLKNLHIKNFRCFENLKIESLGRVNLIVGKNNSGKSSLLKAIHVLQSNGLSLIEDLIDHQIRRNEVSYIDFLNHAANFFYKYRLPTQENETYVGNKEKEKYIEIVTAYETEDEEDGKEGTIVKRKITPISSTIELKGSQEISIAIYSSNNKYPLPVDFRRFRSVTDSRYFQEKPNSSYVPSNLVDPNQLASLWDTIIFTPFEEQTKEALSLIQEDILDVAFIDSKSLKIGRVAVLKVSGFNQPIPIKNMGEGMTRLLQIFLHAFQAKDGVLLIDEFENGLHYSIQQEIWDKLFKLATELDIQIFATTHSEDTIKSFCKASLNSEEEGRLISLGRSTRTSTKGQIKATIFDETELEVISNTGMDVR